jgi:hypothetical protein
VVIGVIFGLIQKIPFFLFLHSIESVCYLKRCATKFGCFSRPNKHEFLEGFISRRVDVDEAIP